MQIPQCEQTSVKLANYAATEYILFIYNNWE